MRKTAARRSPQFFSRASDTGISLDGGYVWLTAERPRKDLLIDGDDSAEKRARRMERKARMEAGEAADVDDDDDDDDDDNDNAGAIDAGNDGSRGASGGASGASAHATGNSDALASADSISREDGNDNAELVRRPLRTNSDARYVE